MNTLLRYWRRYQRARRVKAICAALRKAGRENTEAAEALASVVNAVVNQRIDAFAIRWHCLRCQSTVDMAAFRCQCTESPSPWAPVTDDPPEQPPAIRRYP